MKTSVEQGAKLVIEPLWGKIVVLLFESGMEGFFVQESQNNSASKNRSCFVVGIRSEPPSGQRGNSQTTPSIKL